MDVRSGDLPPPPGRIFSRASNLSWQKSYDPSSTDSPHLSHVPNGSTNWTRTSNFETGILGSRNFPGALLAWSTFNSVVFFLQCTPFRASQTPYMTQRKGKRMVCMRRLAMLSLFVHRIVFFFFLCFFFVNISFHLLCPWLAEHFLYIIRRGQLEPTKKYSEPQTESQEYGWISSPLVRPARRICEFTI